MIPKYFSTQKRNIIKSERLTNVVDLMHKAKLEEKKEKRKNIYITVAAISALAVSGIIISN